MKSRTIPLERIAFFLLWLFVFNLSFDKVFFIPELGRISRLLGMMSAAACVGAVLVERKLRRPLWPHWTMACFAGWAALSYFWTTTPLLTAIRAREYAQLVVLVLLVWQLAGSRPRQRMLLEAFVLGSIVPSLTTIANYFLDQPALNSRGLALPGRYSAFGKDVNHLAFLLVLAIVIAVYLNATERRTLTIWMYRLHFGICLWAVVLTGSRGGFVVALGATCFLVLAYWRLPFRRRTAELLLAGCQIAIVAFLVPEKNFLRLAGVGSELWQTVEHRGRARSKPAPLADGEAARTPKPPGTLGGRTLIWAFALRLYGERPFWGWGAGAFKEISASHFGRVTVARSAFLSVLVGLGPIGLFLFSSTILGFHLGVLRLPGLERAFWGALLLCCLLGLALLRWDTGRTPWVLFGLSAAWAAARPRSEAPTTDRS